MNRAADQPEPNPLREGLSTRAVPQPCAIVIFGATGDLTHRNRLFYFAAAPDQFEPILKHLKAVGLNDTCKGSWVRVIVEKPFGTDLASARELNRIVRNSFAEEQTYRIDHFLGKETAQNI